MSFLWLNILMGDWETGRRGDWNTDETNSLMRSADVDGFLRRDSPLEVPIAIGIRAVAVVFYTELHRVFLKRIVFREFYGGVSLFLVDFCHRLQHYGDFSN